MAAPKLPAAVPKSGRPKSAGAKAAPKTGAANGAAPKSGAATAVAAPKSGAAKAVPKSGAAKAAVPKGRRPKSGAAKAAPKAGAAAAPKPLAAPPAKAAVPKQAEHLPKSLAVPLAEAAVPKPLAVPLAEAAVPKQAERLDNAIVPAEPIVTKAILARRPQPPPGFARMAIPVPKQQGAEVRRCFSATGATSQFQLPMSALPRSPVLSTSAISVSPPSSRCTMPMAHGQPQRSTLSLMRIRLNSIVLRPPRARLGKS